MTINNIYFPNYVGMTGIGSLQYIELRYIEASQLVNPYSVFIKLYFKEGTLKNVWYYNIDYGNNIEKIDFSLNKNGFGECIIKFSEKLNIDIQAEDYIEIYFGSSIVYKGFVVNDIDIMTKEVALLPFLKRLQEWYYFGDFQYKTIDNILQTVFTNLEQKTLIKYDSRFIDTGSNEVISITIENQTPFEVIEKLVKMLEDRYWYIDENNYLHVKKIKRDRIDKYMMLHTNNNNYQDIKVSFDYSNIEATEYKVYRNDDDGNAVLVGNVGNTGNIEYPPLQIVEKIRSIQAIYTTPDVVNNDTAKKLAYAELKQKAKIKQSISIKNVNLKLYIPVIDDYIYFEYYKTFSQYWIIDYIIDNITQIKWKIVKNGVNCDFQCGDLIEEEGQELYRLKKKVRILETINNI